jgi:hypothetical protein
MGRWPPLQAAASEGGGGGEEEAMLVEAMQQAIRSADDVGAAAGVSAIELSLG